MSEALDQVELVERLEGIAKRIRTHHDQAVAAGHVFQKATERMRAEILLCGQALIEAKELLPHGQWIPWVREKCGFSRWTANRYMDAAKPNGADVHLLEKARRFTYTLLSRWAQRVPAPEVVFEWPIEEQRRALTDLEPTERLCVALRTRLGDQASLPGDLHPPPPKESI